MITAVLGKAFEGYTRPSETETVIFFEHQSKAYSPMRVTESGILTAANSEQYANALSPIYFTESGIAMNFNSLQ